MPRTTFRLVALQAVLALAWGMLIATPAAADHGGPHIASGWEFRKFPTPQPACTGGGLLIAGYYDRTDCGFGNVTISNTDEDDVIEMAIVAPDDTIISTQELVNDGEPTLWEFEITPDTPDPWPAGTLRTRITAINSETGNFGEGTFFLNKLGATVGPTSSGYAPGDDIEVTGQVYELDETSNLSPPDETGVAAEFSLRLLHPDGTELSVLGPFTAASDGTFTETFPGAATSGVQAGPETNFETTLSIEVVDATYDDALSGAWVGDPAGKGFVTLFDPPTELVLDNNFTSSVGWVKPGETYPFRVLVRNFTATERTGVEVTIPAPDGTTFMSTFADAGSAPIGGGGDITWTIGSSPAAAGSTPAIHTLVVQAEADDTTEDPQIVWKDLSSTATLSYDGSPNVIDASHGPKVIPEGAAFDTARYGDRPFPVVPVDYFDRKHEAEHTGAALATKINAADYEGSTFNLFQEMSYGQLYPNAAIPSAGIATEDWDVTWTGESGQYSGGEFDFTDPQPNGVCHGATFPQPVVEATSPRIDGGWYQLPGNTDYYGDDTAAEFTAISAFVTGQRVGDIDNGCGPTGKSVYDAAHVADPEIDYNDFDTDKDGVVDFFMMVFVGRGGNADSQTQTPPYDNIWPHSSSLETSYRDPDTGLRGYISDDQLKSLQGVPQCFLDDNFAQFDDCVANGGTGLDEFPVPVRVGPYNVNPETAIDHASVISHEYGHSLGLPDYYSTGGRDTYGTWNLMATDYSQHMDIHARQEMGWVVPQVLEANDSVTASNWPTSKEDTHEIDWVEPDGDPYALTGPGVHNGAAYVAKLPRRIIIDPAKFTPPPGEGATMPHTWWSGSGNDFGCPPDGGHNLDVYLPELADVGTNTPVTVSLKSYWDIEWDFDYGFVLLSTDNGETYTSQESENGYTTPAAVNPNAIGCQQQYGNGITGTSGSYEQGTFATDRTPAVDAYPEGGFLSDEYDISEAAGRPAVLRFSYATDAGLAHPGWFIDDLVVTAGDEVIYEADFTAAGTPADERIFNGGCRESLMTATQCTDGWTYVNASEDNPADHAYYLEMRDRSGFDFDSNGEADRAPGQPTFLPGLSVVYTNEAHGYGNAGTDDPPAQSPLDSQPQPGEAAPNLNDAAWTDTAGDSRFTDGGEGHTDNYEDPSNAEVDSRYPAVANPWRFRYDCLTFDVTSMTGEDVGPDASPGNLEGDVQFETGQGCAPFDYGYEGGPDLANLKPTARIDARPKNPKVGQRVSFDGSASFDDKQTASQLSYAWDFDGDGTFEGSGRSTKHAYDQPGTYPATLRVTDAGGLTDLATATIVVTGCPKAAEGTNQINGTSGRDVIVGTTGSDVICGLGGRDRIRGNGGDDLIVGGPGKDVLRGNGGVDVLTGERGHDRLSGGGGKDRLLGGPGRDRMRGGPGRDQLVGGPGKDKVIGNESKDGCGKDATRGCERGLT